MIASVAATWSAVGKTSFELWLQLTWSLGWTGRASEMPCLVARPLATCARTSFTFMFDCVPEPVCHTLRGKAPGCRPASTSSAASSMRVPSCLSSTPSSTLAWAAAFFTRVRARTMPRGRVSVPMRKFSRERWVWAPQGASWGTRTSPMESCSMRYAPLSAFAPLFVSSASMCTCASCSLVRTRRKAYVTAAPLVCRLPEPVISSVNDTTTRMQPTGRAIALAGRQRTHTFCGVPLKNASTLANSIFARLSMDSSVRNPTCGVRMRFGACTRG